MSFYDPTTGDYTPLAQAVDTTAAQAGDKSIWDNVGDVVTKGAPLAVVSAINSFANTGLELGRFMGVSDTQNLSMHDSLDKLNMGGGELENYYNDHSQGVEAAGLLLGSLVPGTVGLKAFKLAQVGKLGDVAQMATNIFAGPKARIIENAANELNSGSDLVTGLRASKVSAIAMGFGDQALQGMVYQAATTATMKANPLLDENGVGDTVNDILYAGATNGILGGLFGAYSTLGKFKSTRLEVEKSLSPVMGTDRYGAVTKFDGGDRVAQIVNNLDDIKNALTAKGKDASELFTATGNRNINNAISDAKIALKDIVPDQQVANDLIETSVAKLDGSLDTRNRLSDYFTGLKKVERITSTEEAPVNVGDVRYINSYPKGTPVTFEDLITNAPRADAKISLAHTIDPNAELRMATSDMTYNLNGVSVPKFNNSDEAFAAGFDMFRNDQMHIIVNPESGAITRVARPGESRVLTQVEEAAYRTIGKLPEGSKNLLSGQLKFDTPLELNGPASSFAAKPMIHNLITGAEKESAIPVIGDYGKPTATNNGVSAGGQTWTHDLASVITPESTPQEANSRFIWAANRGIKANDIIQPNDLPMLEQIYKEGTSAKTGWNTYIQDTFTRKGVTFADNGPELGSADDLLSYIKAEKDTQLKTLVGDPATGMSHEEAAIRTNVPESYIEGGQTATASKDLIVPPSQWMKTNNVKLWHDVGSVNTNNGMILKGMQDQQYRIDLIKDQVTSEASQYFGDKLPQFQITKTSADANSLGTGNRFLTFDRPNYGSLGEQTQRTQLAFAKFQEQKMGGYIKLLTQPAAALRNDITGSAETGAFIAARHATGEKFMELPEALVQQHFPERFVKDAATSSPKQVGMVAVLKDSLGTDPETKAITWNREYLPSNFIDGAAAKEGKAGNYNFYHLGEASANWERAYQGINDEMIKARNNWYAANGLSRQLESGTLHAPAIDTNKYPYFALVRERTGSAMNDGGSAMIVAKDADTLQKRIAGLQDDYEVFTKNEIAKHKEALGEYEYSRNFNDSRVNSELKRRGILNDVIPDSDPDVIINNYLDNITRNSLSLGRDHIESLNGQLFAELKAMGEVATFGQSSRMGNRILGDYVENPYDSYIKSALNINDKDRYQLWHNSQEKLSAFGDKAFDTVKNAFGLASKGKVSWEEASDVAKRFGLGNPYSDLVKGIDRFGDAGTNQMPQRDVLRRMSHIANSAMGTSVISLDTFQQMLHVLSTPILLASEGLSASNALKDLMTTELPDGSQRMIPSTSKTIFKSIGDFFSSAYQKEWTPLYKSINAIREPESQYLNDLKGMSLPWGNKGMQKFDDFATNAINFGKKYSGANFTEHFTSWVAADVAKKIFSAGGLEGTDLTDAIGNFVNRIKGTQIANQRPVAFQGPLGSAIGLFQTYQFNMYQNILRYVENVETKSLATAFAMQGTLFGMQGLPGFQAINQAIGGISGNTANGDIYSATNDFAGKKLGDYLLYGVASNWMNANMYSRSDINPRQVSILPINPLNYPAISGSIRVVGNLYDTAKKIAEGGDVSGSLLMGIEHNGLNRPLAGLAQLIQGYSTTEGGDLQSKVWPTDNTMGLNELWNAGIFSRLLGARPLDEGIALNAQSRKEYYQAQNTTKLSALGDAVKTTMYGGQSPSQEQIENFANEYAKVGGDMNNFGRSLVDWSNKANASVANQVFKKMGSPRSQNLMRSMGGNPLPDFRTQGTTAPAATNQGETNTTNPLGYYQP